MKHETDKSTEGHEPVDSRDPGYRARFYMGLVAQNLDGFLRTLLDQNWKRPDEVIESFSKWDDLEISHSYLMECLNSAWQFSVLDLVLKWEPNRPKSIFLCREHGGIGFVSDCTECQVAKTSSKTREQR